MLQVRRQSGLPTLIVCALIAAAVSACGGGGGGAASATAEAAASTGTAAASTPAGDDAVATAASNSAAIASTTTGDDMVATAADLAIDGATAVAPDDAAFVSDATIGASIDALADDDGSGNSKVDALAGSSPRPTIAVLLASEGQSFQVPGTMTVQYGAGASWVARSVTSSGTCTGAFFNTAAAASTVAKTCRVVVVSGPATTTAATAIGLPTREGGTFFVFGTRAVQFGLNGKLVRRDVTGRAECSNAFFGTDPAVGNVKSCSFAPAGASTLAAGSQAPVVNAAKIPAAAAGHATDRVRAANVADASQNPARSDIGNFREYCEFSHMSYDDPIVAPNSVSGHLHVFLGNTGTSAGSTAASIAGSGNSTCAGGTLNRTAYWVPALIDTADGAPQKPLGSLIYYKQGYDYVPSAAIRPFPAGLRIVAGSAASSGPQDKEGFTCYRADGTWKTTTFLPPDCPSGSTLTISVAFPQCWDGVNLDAPDHKSHMAYPGIGCPATHPVALTAITFNINYKVGPTGTSRWRLSSDNYDPSLPAGFSSHADWFNGWNPDIMTVWTTRCINATLDCHAFLIGDGRILY